MPLHLSSGTSSCMCCNSASKPCTFILFRDLRSWFKEKLEGAKYGPQVEGAFEDLPKPDALRVCVILDFVGDSNFANPQVAAARLDDYIKDNADNLDIFHKLRCFDPRNVKDMNNSWNQRPTVSHWFLGNEYAGKPSPYDFGREWLMYVYRCE